MVKSWPEVANFGLDFRPTVTKVWRLVVYRRNGICATQETKNAIHQGVLSQLYTPTNSELRD